MSDSVQPHRWQPTRLHHPWDSPGKNTGVGCHFPLQCMKEKSESEVSQSCPSFSDPMDCSLPGSSVHGIFQARVLEWGAIAFRTSIFSFWLLLLRPLSHSCSFSLTPLFSHTCTPICESLCVLKFYCIVSSYRFLFKLPWIYYFFWIYILVLVIKYEESFAIISSNLASSPIPLTAFSYNPN